MNASDMEALFKPVPFGDTGHRSAITQAAAPAMVPVWDLFRNIDEDKQNVTLQVPLLPHAPPKPHNHQPSLQFCKSMSPTSNLTPEIPSAMTS